MSSNTKAYSQDYYQRNKAKWKEYPSQTGEGKQRTTLCKKFGITLGERNEILEDQGNVCAICKRPHDTKAYRWHVDHCHGSGFVRGVLCHGCNIGIGHLREDPMILRNALHYVEKFQRINGGKGVS